MTTPASPTEPQDSTAALASLSEAYRQRFSGVARLYGQAGLVALSKAHFVVIGIGGVGTWVAESLARSGVGTLTLIDMDDVCITNSNRQLHALQSTIGQSKTAVMAARLRDINPEIMVHEVDDFLSQDNLSTLIRAEHHVVIDAIDAAYVKAALIAHCKRNKKQIISVGSAGGKRDPRDIISGDLSRSVNDPLLAKTRNALRRLHNFSRNTKRVFSIEVVYSKEQMLYPRADGGVCQSRAEMDTSEGTKLDCSGGFGAATMVTASFGLVAAARAIERYLERL